MSICSTVHPDSSWPQSRLAAANLGAVLISSWYGPWRGLSNTCSSVVPLRCGRPVTWRGAVPYAGSADPTVGTDRLVVGGGSAMYVRND